MPIKHSYTATGPDDPTRQVSVNRWNADHTWPEGDTAIATLATITPALVVINDGSVKSINTTGKFFPCHWFCVAPAGTSITITETVNGIDTVLMVVNDASGNVEEQMWYRATSGTNPTALKAQRTGGTGVTAYFGVKP